MLQNIQKLKMDVEKIHSKIGVQSSLSLQEKETLDTVLSLLDQGDLRVATYENNRWIIHPWLKQAIIAHIHYTTPYDLPYGMPYHDHTGYKYQSQPIQEKRIVPSAYIRYGAYLGKKTIIMPSFINTGAYIGDGTMIDTYASIGSCAQIGRQVHISAGTGIGGVLEPLQSSPTIIEDHCFIGPRSEISEGVIVKQGAVLAGGLHISRSTRIYNRLTDQITYGIIPENAVVVPGSIPSPDGKYAISSAIIVKIADHNTRAKTKINDLLRSFD